MNELFRSLRDQLCFTAKTFASKVVSCCFKDVIRMYKVTGKAAGGKELFDDADRNRVCVRTSFTNT